MARIIEIIDEIKSRAFHATDSEFMFVGRGVPIYRSNQGIPYDRFRLFWTDMFGVVDNKLRWDVDNASDAAFGTGQKSRVIRFWGRLPIRSQGESV